MPTLLSNLLAAQGALALHTQRTYIASTTFVVPADVRVMELFAVGGGGGGGSAPSGATNAWPGGGGGGGQVMKATMPVSPGETLTITIGTGGAPGAYATRGAQGNATSVTGSTSGLLISAAGGIGGSAGGANLSTPTALSAQRRQTMSTNLATLGLATRDGEDVYGWGGSGTAGTYSSNYVNDAVPGLGGGRGACYARIAAMPGRDGTGGGGGGGAAYGSGAGVNSLGAAGGAGYVQLDYDTPL